MFLTSQGSCGPSEIITDETDKSLGKGQSPINIAAAMAAKKAKP